MEKNEIIQGKPNGENIKNTNNVNAYPNICLFAKIDLSLPQI
jgi:hypothetical protein